MPQPEGHLPQVVKKKEGHMPELRKRRSHLALLGVFAMVASVLAAGASPASAEAGKVDAGANYSACVGPATVDAGFTDVATGSTHDAAVNCIAYYGITRGTTATTFEPNRTIPRWQLAVMLQRASGPAGVDLPADEDVGFTDISGLNAAFQTAINQMATLGVMAGTTATTFDPSGTVSRATIVEALAGFLTNANVGPGGKALARDVNQVLSLKDGTGNNAQDIAIDESFRDIGGVTYSANQAIRALAEMAVVSGRADGTFGPAASVTRAQAAAFITRALAHTNARPAGLTMQAAKTDGSSAATVTGSDEFDLAISVRGNDFAPVESAEIDVFHYSARNSGTAFKTDGTCNTGIGGVEATAGGVGACTIEVSDEVTEPDGNLILENVEPISQDTVFWAWAGETGAKLDWDTAANLSMDNNVVSSAASFAVSTVTTPTSAKVATSVSRDAATGNTVRYGTTVTITIQLRDENDKNIGVAGQTYTWWAEGAHDSGQPQISSTGSRRVVTNSDGKATFTLTQSDPNTARSGPLAASNNNRTTWTYRINAVDGAPPVAANTVAVDGFELAVTSGVGVGSVIFDDDPSSAEKVSISLQRAWTPQPTQGGSASVGVTGKVTDQYGNPQRNVRLFFDIDGNDQFGCSDPSASDCGSLTQAANTGDDSVDKNGTTTVADDVIGGTNPRTTRSSGTNTIAARISGTVVGGTSGDGRTGFGLSSPTYTVAADLNDDDDVSDPGEMDSATHYWTQIPAGFMADTGKADATGRRYVHIADLDNNVLVIESWAPDPPGNRVPRAYSYTDTTLFQWYIATDTSDVRWLDTAEFERRMGKVLEGADNTANRPVPVRVDVVQYNTKTGFSVFEVVLDGGQDIQDPPATP